MPLYDILLPLLLDKPFTYQSEQSLIPGQLVVIPIRGKESVGLVLGDTKDYKGEAKSVIQGIEYPPYSEDFISFLKWVGGYNVFSLGMLFKMSLPPLKNGLFSKKSGKGLSEQDIEYSYKPVEFSDEQKDALTLIQSHLKEHKPFLIDGVTGSGKTEIYFELIHQSLVRGEQSLILLPEINLTSQWLERFKKRFGFEPVCWHSHLTPSQKQKAWDEIVLNKFPIIVGARSALFLPYQNLSLIVVDEEHDSSYKQEEQGFYNARDMAVVRSHIEKIPILLCSATPSIETYHNCQKGKYLHVKLMNRPSASKMPTIHCVDLRQEKPKNWLSSNLLREVQNNLNRQEQSLLFLNRRGYAPLTLCKSCGHRFTCPSCQFSLVDHKKGKENSILKCHYCGFYQDLPSHCPSCEKEEDFHAHGPGVNRVYDDLKAYFPDARIKIYSSDTLSSKKKVDEFYQDVSQHQVDILIGTQLLAKGHDFPSMTLVGIIDADLGLGTGDLRACEKTYQILHQVCGRSGRGIKPGQVILQTYQPEHPVIKAILDQDRDGFLSLELYQRQLCQMPPYNSLASVIISGLNELDVQKTAEQFAKIARSHVSREEKLSSIQILGPVSAPIAFLRSRHRWRILINGPKEIRLGNLVQSWSKSLSPIYLKKTDVQIDIDPQSFF